MECQEASGAAIRYSQAAGRSLAKGTGSGLAAAVQFPPLRQDLTRRSMTYE